MLRCSLHRDMLDLAALPQAPCSLLHLCLILFGVSGTAFHPHPRIYLSASKLHRCFEQGFCVYGSFILSLFVSVS